MSIISQSPVEAVIESWIQSNNPISGEEFQSLEFAFRNIGESVELSVGDLESFRATSCQEVRRFSEKQNTALLRTTSGTGHAYLMGFSRSEGIVPVVFLVTQRETKRTLATLLTGTDDGS